MYERNGYASVPLARHPSLARCAALCHFRVRLAFLDGNVSLLGVLDVHGGDRSVTCFHRGGLFSSGVDIICPSCLRLSPSSFFAS